MKKLISSLQPPYFFKPDIKKCLFFSSLFLIVLFSGCKKDEIEENRNIVPNEIIKNPMVIAAVEESGIEINEGFNPPSLEGRYLLSGEITDGSFLFTYLIGLKMYSEIELYNQTEYGEIDFQENVAGYTATARGGYITGEDGEFSIWQESEQNGSEAGLPEDVTIKVVLLMSGTQLDNGNLNVKGLSIVTEANSTNSDYATEYLEGIWRMWEAEFELQTEDNKSAIIDSDSQEIELIGSKVLQLLVDTDYHVK